MNSKFSGIESQIFRNKTLLKALVIRDIKMRYAGASLGVMWSVIQPLTLLFIYIIVFSTLMAGGRISFNNGSQVPYAVFLCPCLLAWNWYCEAVNGACNAILSNASLIKKSAFPAAILPCVPVFSSLIPFLVVLLCFFVYQFLFTASFSMWEFLLFIPVILLQLFFISGISYFVAALNVVIRDTAQIVNSILQIMFWATPIVYDVNVITQKYPHAKYWYFLNPFSHLMTAWREAIILHSLPSLPVLVSLLFWSTVLYMVGHIVFRRASSRFVEQV